MRGYDELRVTIEPGPSDGYRVRAVCDTAEVSGRLGMPVNAAQVDDFVRRAAGRRRGGYDAPTVAYAKDFGRQLFDALFRDEIYALYREARVNAFNKNCGLRIKLSVTDASELLDVPWEYLCDDGMFLCTSTWTPVVRTLALPRPSLTGQVEPPLRILGMVSSPEGEVVLDVEQEKAHLTEALSDLENEGVIKLEWLERATRESLRTEMRDRPFHVFHYIGHGSYTPEEGGKLHLEDDRGGMRAITAKDLVECLRDNRSLRLTVLNACEGARTAPEDPFAGVGHSIVKQGIPAVVAMQFSISDEAAIVFAHGFYKALADFQPVDVAVTIGRQAIYDKRSDDIEWGTPVLFLRPSDGRLFPPKVGDGPPLPSPPPPIPDGPVSGRPPPPRRRWPPPALRFLMALLAGVVLILSVVGLRPAPPTLISKGDWRATVGALTVRVTRVERTGDDLRLRVRAHNAGTASLKLLGLSATDQSGETHEIGLLASHWDVPAGIGQGVVRWIKFRGIDRARRLDLSIGQVFGLDTGTPDGSLVVRAIPVPQYAKKKTGSADQ